jgi:hypothetical protein
MDGLDLPKTPSPAIWKRGAAGEVAFALNTNHGGGYSYRLCKADGVVNESCFQKTVLKFASDKQFIQYSGEIVPGAPRYEIPLMKVTTGTFPAGSEWARNPVPACNFCDENICGPSVEPDYTQQSGWLIWGNTTIPFYGGEKWLKHSHCGTICAGENPAIFENTTWSNSRPHGLLCEGRTQFPEPLPFVSGLVRNGTYPEKSVTSFSVVDLMQVPADIEPGHYLLSWRWDCEQTPQVWQNCADVVII